MSSPVDVFRARLAKLSDAPRSIAAIDLAVCAPRACNRSRKSRPRRSRTNAVSNFASTDATKAHPPLEQKESNAGSREFPVQSDSVQHRCRFDFYQKFWNGQGRDADPGACRRILRKEFS